MDEFGRELRAQVLSLAVLGVVAYVIYRQVKGDLKDAAAVIPSFGEVSGAAGDIIKSGPSALLSYIKGEDETGYITREEQQARAAAQLAAVQAAKRVALMEA